MTAPSKTPPDAASWQNPDLKNALQKKCQAEVLSWLEPQIEENRVARAERQKEIDRINARNEELAKAAEEASSRQNRKMAPKPPLKGAEPPEVPLLKAYAFIDAGQIFTTKYDLPRFLKLENLPPIRLFEETPLEDLADIGAYLVPLPVENQARLQKAVFKLCALMTFGWTVSFFTTRMSREDLLCDYFRHFFIAIFDDKEESRALFASYDPQLLPVLIKIAPAIVDAFSKPMHSWAYWNFNLEFKNFRGGDEQLPKAPPERLKHFSQRDEDRFAKATENGLILKRLREYAEENAPWLLLDFAPHLQRQLVEEWSQNAEKLHLDGIARKLAFCKLCLRYPHPENLSSLKNLAATPDRAPQTFDSVYAQLGDESAWDEKTLAEGRALLFQKRQAFADFLKVLPRV